MVFESYVVDLVNKFAGQYLENLDPSQLRLGIWGGDAKLENLILKESALDDLDLPVKVLRGHLGKLVLKIPWKNLYSEPVVAKIDGLYLLVRPNTGIKYNAEKEENAKQEKKKRQLEAIELARKLEEEKKKAASGMESKDEKQDSFVEKLAIQVVKNLQIYISNIHVRYEDTVTDPSSPFSIGITLENLSAQSTDENWLPSIVGTSVQIIHKLVELNSLAVYWNTTDNIGKLPSQEEWVNIAKGGIAAGTSQDLSKPEGFRYVLQPVSATTKVKLDTKPGSDLSNPKVFLSLVLEEIFLVLTKHQYHDVMKLLESFDYMSRNIPFRMFKPDVPLKGNTRRWWHYAMNSILEEEVKRKHRNWSWSHMKSHRAICKEYKMLFKKKLLTDKLSKDQQKHLEKLEKKLDVLNITICRQQAEYEEAAALRKKKKKAQEKQEGGFFSGWFGSSKKQKSAEKEQTEILSEEQKKEELGKLYAAIGYSENEAITSFPKEYVENKVVVHLKQIGVNLRDDSESSNVKEIVKFSIQDLYADLTQRPSAQAIRVTAKVDEMKMYGTPLGTGTLPLVITSHSENEESHLALFSAAFETNPLDGKCDQRAEVVSQPLKIVYDSNTVEEVIHFFEPPQDVHLEELSAAALSRLEALKTASKASLAYAVEHHTVTDVNVNLKSPYIIIPEKGCFEGSTSVLVIDLGHLKITSDTEQERVVSTKFLSISELESKCYDKFDIRLEQFQVLIAKQGDDWDAARRQTKSAFHILDPLAMDLKLQKALNPDDIRLAQIKLSGSLPFINVRVNDKKLELAMKLALSIPIPGAEASQDTRDGPPKEVFHEGRRFIACDTFPVSTNLGVLEGSLEEDEPDDDEFKTPTGSPELTGDITHTADKEAMEKQVKVAVTFEIEQVCVNVGIIDETNQEIPCLVLSLKHLGTDITMHPHDLRVSASIGSLALQEMSFGPDGGPMYLIQTPRDAALLSVDIIKADRSSPEYHTTFQSTALAVAVDFTSLTVLLHQEALLKLMDLSSTLIPTIEENKQSVVDKSKEIKHEIDKLKDKSRGGSPKKKKKKKKGGRREEVNVDLKAKLGGISVVVTSVQGDVAHVLVGGLSAHITVMDDRTNVNAVMKDLSVVDTTPAVLYPNIVSIVNQEVFSVEVVVYNDAMSNGNITNMDVVDTSFKMNIGCIRVIFLNKFVMELLAFLNNFQKAKEAMEYARKSAAEKAAAKIQDIQSQSARISLAVSIQAPLIIIPISSRSRDALVADLGRLSVSNTFSLTKPGTKADGSDAVIVDNMVVELSSVKLSRALVKDGESIEATSTILEPLSMTIYLARSLSAWYHQIPDIDVSGKLHAVKLCTGEQDISTILAVLFQNLSEGKIEQQAQPVIEDTADERAQAVVAVSSLKGSADDTKPPQNDVWDTVKFAFEIESVTAAVYWKEQLELTPESSSDRDPACCLGQFSLVSVSASGKMKSNMALTALVTLESCILDDKRPESETGVTRMMDRFMGDGRQIPNMIDVKFQQSANLDKNITIEVNNVHIVVNLEFLLVLSNVFTSALSAAPPSSVPSAADTTQALAKIKTAVPLQSVHKEPPELRLAFSVKQPEIVLLADAKDKATNALLLTNSLEFNFLITQGQQKMFGHLENLSITSAAFDLEKRAATKSQAFLVGILIGINGALSTPNAFQEYAFQEYAFQVLYLSRLALHGSAPEGQGMHLDIRSGVAQVHVSPPTIKTITACLMSLAPAKDEEADKAKYEDDVTLWSQKIIDEKRKWYLAQVPEDQLIPGRRIYGRWPKNKRYYAGYIAKIDSRIHLQFDDNDKTSHDINDITAVLIDAIPDAMELKVGTEVIASDPKAGYYYSRGKITKIERVDGVVMYHVRYDDGQEGWNALNSVRVLMTKKPGVADNDIVPSSIVYVRHKSGYYYKGFVSSKLLTRFTIRTYRGDVVNVSIHDTPAIVLDRIPSPGSVFGSTVIGSWKNKEHWYIGKVIDIKMESGVRLFHVLFDDGDNVWHNVENIRIVNLRKPDVPEGTIDVGSFVWAWWSNISYYRAFVSHKGSKLHVDFYDGDKHLYELKDALVTILPDVNPKPSDLRTGTRVIAKYKKRVMYFSGTVIEVDMSRDDQRYYNVEFDDGDADWNILYRIRLLPKDVTPGFGRPLRLSMDRDWLLVGETNPDSYDDGGGPQSSQQHIEAGKIDVERGEMMLFNMEGFSIKMEGAFGGQMVPLLSMNGQIQAEVKDWSTKLSASAGMSLTANYFNENISEWEPLIEPVQEKNKYRPWELAVEFAMGSVDNGAENGDETVAGDLDVEDEPAMSLTVKSSDDLQITVTKTGLDVFKKLGAAFGEAVSLQGEDKIAMEDLSPYVIRNELGLGIKVYLGDDLKAPPGYSENVIPIAGGQDLPLYLSQGFNHRASKKVRGAVSELAVTIEVEGYHAIKNIPIKQARVAFYNIIPRQLLRGTTMSAVMQVESGEGQKIVTVRSPLQVHNHFSIPMDLCCKREIEMVKVTTIPPLSVYSVPLILSYRAGLYLKPSGFGYNDTGSPLLWNQLRQARKARFTCISQTPGEPPFYIEVVCEKALFTVSQGMQANSPVYTFHIYPPTILHNYLPYSVHYSTEGIPFVSLKGGENCSLYSVDLTNGVPLYIQVDGYMEDAWRGEIELRRGMDELTTFTLAPSKPGSTLRPVELGVFTQFDGTMNITIYSPYWMVNKTGMFIEYKASDDDVSLLHPESLNDVVMYSYRGKGGIFAKKTTKIKLAGSEWSAKFSLDTVGSGGSLKIKRHGKEYEIGILISLSYFSLTKVVEFTPFHLLNNHTEYPVSLCEAPDDSNLIWTTVNPGECIPVWPTHVPPKDLVIRVADGTENSARFNFEPDVSVLLRMEGKVGAVCVEMLSKDSAAIMTFTPYFAGAAPVRIENCTTLEIHYKQDSKDSTEYTLHPKHCILYTWDQPMDKNMFIWYAKGEASKSMRTTDLTEVGHGSFKVDKKKFYWATFLDGLQRVLLIIDDFTLAYRAQVEQPERISQEITLEIHGIGLSLVNNEKSIEVAYIGITPSQIIWEEMKKKGRWKALKLGTSQQLEEAWIRVEHVTSFGGEPNFRQKLGELEVDFEVMEIIHPRRRAMRRSFTPGFSIKYIASAHELELFTKVNSVQIDSQIPGSTFQTVLHPVPPPKSVAADNAPKPFFEMSVLTRQVEHSQVNEIKYFKVLIQEMETMVDMGFLTALIDLFSSDTIDRSQELTQYIADKKRVLDALGEAHAVQAALDDKKNYFDYFHLSPLKIHLSFSQLGGASSDDKEKSGIHIGSSFINLLMQSVGVAVTEVQDVEFKLAYFEIINQVYNQQQLTSVIVKHYTSQAIKQMYVLVLGLDVLGNPFALITGLKDGAKDLFYEPYQGLIQGPGEFAEGLALGVRSLVGHTVGGAAGAVSRITGTLGKGIAALTMDDKYQQERRQAMGKKPVNVAEGLARGGKGLLEGVLGGVTGIVTKPMEGAREHGAAGFFKGLGKGVVGVVARPAGGLVDFASSTLEGIKGSADTAREVKQLRPPRVFYADKVMKPYHSYEAAGNAILQGTKKNHSSLGGDMYYAHSALNIKKALLITNKHIIVAGKTEVFGNWECDWSCEYSELTAEPTFEKNKLILKVPDKGRVIFKRSEIKAITTPSPEVAQWLVTQIKEARS